MDLSTLIPSHPIVFHFHLSPFFLFNTSIRPASLEIHINSCIHNMRQITYNPFDNLLLLQLQVTRFQFPFLYDELSVVHQFGLPYTPLIPLSTSHHSVSSQSHVHTHRHTHKTPLICFFTMSMEDNHVFPPRENQNLRHPHQPPPTPVKPMTNNSLMGSSYPPDEANRRAFCTCITTVILLVGLLVLVLWLVYRPTKPHFAVVGAAVYGLNATTPPLMSTTMQFTIVIQNPNRRVSIYFDTLSAYVSYRNHPITTPVALPPLYMEERSSVSLSPMIGGSPVPVSPDVSNGLAMDEAYGVVGVSVIMQGRLRWKTGAVRTAHYGIYVKCDVMMSLKKGFSGQVPLTGAPACYVDI